MILHVIKPDKFIPPFIELMDECIGRDNHKYVFIAKESYEYGLKPEHNVEFLQVDIALLEYMKKAKKIILHGLWREEVNILLYFNQNLLRKCYWVMWGGDFYFPEKHSQIKKEIIKNMGYLVTGTLGDVELVRKWYGAKGLHIICFNYPSNTVSKYSLQEKTGDVIRIQLGNSADPTNRHEYLIDKLVQFKNSNIEVYAPLSYGNQQYAKKIIEAGKNKLGNKFIPLTEFMQLEEYNKLQSDFDIAMFAHKRQQAFGNILTLLAMGKKVYLDRESTLYPMLEYLGANIFDIENFNCELISKEIALENNELITEKFSREKLIASLKGWLA